jgi:hypothetical protein
LEVAQALKQSEHSEPQQIRDIRAFLKLPLAEQQRQLEQQAAMLAPYFQPGSEDMEWVEAYVEDDDWDNKARSELAGLFLQGELTDALTH